MKKKYFMPDIERIKLDDEISIMLQSVEDTNPENEPEWVLNSNSGVMNNLFKNEVG